MMKLPALLILLMVFNVNCQTYDRNTVFGNKADLSGSDYKLEWDYTTTDIVFRATVKTNGWVGFGLSNTGGMAGSDIILAWTGSDGSIQFRDAHTEGYSVKYDTIQNWQKLFYSQINGETTVIFKRAIHVCNPNQPLEEINVDISTWQPLIVAQDIIYSWGTVLGDYPIWHGSNRGSELLQIGSVQPPPSCNLPATTQAPYTISFIFPFNGSTNNNSYILVLFCFNVVSILATRFLD